MKGLTEYLSCQKLARRGLTGVATAVGIALLPLIATGVGQETTPTHTVLYTFTGREDGGQPRTGLTADGAGNLYGTTLYEGSGSSSCSAGCGVIFKVDAEGSETVLHAFKGAYREDGTLPSASLIRDAADNLYGTTGEGGDISSCGGFGCGVVFKLDPSGNETVLHSFTGGMDGQYPYASLIRDDAGNLYGTTQFGGDFGAFPCADGCGVVFKLDPLGKETVLHTFTGAADGVFPEGELLLLKGSLYGTTSDGGGARGAGVVFKLH